MQKLLQAGALALALTGFAMGGTVAPAQAATMSYGAPGAAVTVHVGPRYHPRHWGRHPAKAVWVIFCLRWGTSFSFSPPRCCCRSR